MDLEEVGGWVCHRNIPPPYTHTLNRKTKTHYKNKVSKVKNFLCQEYGKREKDHLTPQIFRSKTQAKKVAAERED